ncbi:exodeoxyribonuclease V subunit gamma [Phototrophicus methaneseepsis]|uniref:Exodeoxyribonuclease V subunit gamma n=1 Tax=Phototrophicus methaneseepsis TaxID=2710758 RepID=A0A7S8E7I1_9CHLR|nr:PD-(D/E)XK nuclease family protein [Phototrophicus methaneseepsis]QPC81769.1 exodeoxyribonuclease V subunit gamma [Phototrophicus methaneseepsis]
MTTTVLQAQVGAGKTALALRQLLAVMQAQSQRLPRIWVLLATKRQEFAFRERMLAELATTDPIAFFNVEFFNFYELNNRLLNLAGEPPRKINEAARLGILRQVLAGLNQSQDLPFYGSIAHTAGFLRVVASLIDELKQNRVTPEQYSAAAQAPKDHELAMIYAQYQALLQQGHLADREGESWLALESVERHVQLASDVDLLLIDGYDQFTPVQAMLVAALSQRVGQALITLTGLPASVQRVGLRFQQALQQLQSAHEALGTSFTVQQPALDPHPHRQPDLNHLARQLFASQNLQVQPNDRDSVHLIEAPEPAEETAAVLRAVKQKLLQGQAAPEDILVVVRDWHRYQHDIETYTRLYDLPVLRHFAQPIYENPAIVALMRLLQLADVQRPERGFRRRDVLDVLRSPYLAIPGFMDVTWVDLLDRISREKAVISGWAEWETALDPASGAVVALDEDADEEADYLASVDELSDLSLSLETFFGQVTPPAMATVEEYVAWVDALLGSDSLDDGDQGEWYDGVQPEPKHYAVLHCIREGADAHLIRRDVAAIHSLKRLMRGMLETDVLLQSIHMAPQTVSWGAFLADLQLAIKNAMPEAGKANRSGRVLITGATEARGLPHQHVYILGMAEGVFPMPASEDPLYLDSERRALTARGVMLRPGNERSDDDGLFYELVNLAQATLTLSRPTVRDGKAWNPSHLWRRVCDAFVPDSLWTTRYGVGETVPALESAALDEVLLAAVSEAQNGVRAYLIQQHSDLWAHVMHNIQVEQGRLSRQPHDAYTGKLSHPALVAQVQDELGLQRQWSASQLNEYGTCAFRFFASRFLKLEALEEPEEGMDALQLGSLNHAILEQTYRQLGRDGIAISPDSVACAEALDILEEVAQICFVKAPREYGFRPTARWQQEQQVILRRLQLMIQLDFSESAPLPGADRLPYDMELRFGFANSPQVAIPINDEERIYVRGSIDRVDRIGDTLYVIDYKSGSTQIPLREMETGRNFQMMVYLLALEDILRQRGETNLRVGGGFFWHIRNQKDSGKVDMDVHFESIEAARKHLTRHLHHARQGDFRVQPGKVDNARCTSYCDFYQLCRLSVTNQYKYP